MRKCSSLRGALGIGILFAAGFAGRSAAAASDASVPAYSALAGAQLDRAKIDLEKIQVLVDQGTLPNSRLEEARAKVADAQDEATLSATLYSPTRLQDMTPAQAADMLAAAQRRVDRQQHTVEARQQLLDMGIVAKAEIGGVTEELEARRRVLELARNRVTLLDQLHEMAAEEQQLERAAQAGIPSLKDSMIRFDGNGHFSLGDMTTLSAEFEKRFHHALPVTALGQTFVHQAMGLDHHDRVDVGLNPEMPEGIWLRQLLERLHVPYLAFRNAVAGAATAPHIHIGTGSTRLRLAQR